MKDYYTIQELADLCHVGLSTIYRLIKNGGIIATRGDKGMKGFQISEESAQDFINNLLPEIQKTVTEQRVFRPVEVQHNELIAHHLKDSLVGEIEDDLVKIKLTDLLRFFDFTDPYIVVDHPKIQLVPTNK